MSFAGDRTFMESLALIIKQRAVVARVSFAAPIDTAGRTRREVSAMAEASVASLLGLERSRTKPGTPAGR
jgi:uncharacterized protein (DUF2342 family)